MTHFHYAAFSSFYIPAMRCCNNVLRWGEQHGHAVDGGIAGEQTGWQAWNVQSEVVAARWGTFNLLSNAPFSSQWFGIPSFSSAILPSWKLVYILLYLRAASSCRALYARTSRGRHKRLSGRYPVTGACGGGGPAAVPPPSHRTRWRRRWRWACFHVAHGRYDAIRTRTAATLHCTYTLPRCCVNGVSACSGGDGDDASGPSVGGRTVGGGGCPCPFPPSGLSSQRNAFTKRGSM